MSNMIACGPGIGGKLETRFDELKAELAATTEKYDALDQQLRDADEALAALKARHCEDCATFMVCSNEVETASGEAWTVDYCSRWAFRV